MLEKKNLWQIGFIGYFIILGAAAVFLLLTWESAPETAARYGIWLGPLWGAFYLMVSGIGVAEFFIKSRIELSFLLNAALSALCVYLMTEGHNIAGSVAVIALLLLNAVFLFYQLQNTWGKIAYAMAVYACFLGVLLFFAYRAALFN